MNSVFRILVLAYVTILKQMVFLLGQVVFNGVGYHVIGLSSAIFLVSSAYLHDQKSIDLHLSSLQLYIYVVFVLNLLCSLFCFNKTFYFMEFYCTISSKELYGYCISETN